MSDDTRRSFLSDENFAINEELTHASINSIRSHGWPVIETEHYDPSVPRGGDSLATGAEMEAHPLFKERQDFDGMNQPQPGPGDVGYDKYQEAERKQEEEYQMKMGLSPKPSRSNTPRPSGY